MARSLATGSASVIDAAVFALLLLLLSASTVQAQPASLVADIAQGAPLSSGFFDFIPFSSPTVTIGSSAYFFADDQIHGKELWVTDGTQAGSHLVVDICPGSCSAGGLSLTAWNGRLFFWASDGDHAGGGPWSSDGSAAGTLKLADAPPTSALMGFFGLGAYVYFAADDATHGAELWRTDGTPGGTGLFADINPGPAPSSLSLLAASSTQLFFRANDGSSGDVLWRTDGSLGGTWPLPAVFPGGLAARGSLLPGGDIVLASFPSSGHREVWRSDGTLGGTSLITDFGADGSSLKAFQLLAAKVYFAHNGELWGTDGAPPGTSLVATIPDGGTITSWVMAPAGGLLYFGASTTALGNELWKSDGTSSGTSVVKDLNPGSANGISSDIFTVIYGGSLGAPLAPGNFFFYGEDGVHGFEPWTTDGSEAGTMLLADIVPGAGRSVDSLSMPGALGGEILFRVFTFPGPSALWRTDGTEAGTQQVVQPNQQVSSLTWPFPAQFTPTAHGALFRADDHQHGMQFWVADPPNAPHLLADLSPLGAFQVEARLGGRAFLTAGDISQTGQPTELLATDGAAVQALDTVSSNGYFQSFFAFDGDEFYTRADITGPSLWRSDGSPGGTTAVAAWPGASGVGPFVSGNGIWIAVSTSSSSGVSLWHSDGTPAGTAPVATLARYPACLAPQADGGLLVAEQTFSGLSSSTAFSKVTTGGVVTALGVFPKALASCQTIDDRLFFFVDDGVHGVEPWIADGTPGGTAMLADIAPGANSSYDGLHPAPALTSAGRVFFVADDGVHGAEPWATDGTPGGTALLDDIAPGFTGSRLSDLMAFGPKMIFTSDDQVHGRELWISDGTSSGTRLLADTRVGPSSSVPQGMATVDGLLLFSATDGTHGRELYASDGSPGSSTLIQDIAPSAESSSPTGFAAIGPNVYFYADDATHGFEPWKLPRRALANAVPAALDFYTSTPCRLIDTRTSAPLAAGVPVTLPVVGQCGIPAEAQAIAVNVTTVGATDDGAIAIYPADDPGPGPGLAPVVASRTRATNAILRISLDDVGSLTALAQLPAGAQMHLVVDVSGYFAP